MKLLEVSVNLTNEDLTGGTMEKQPKWCSLPKANSFHGCWSLFYKLIKNKDCCKKCDYFSE